jgi:hypothetical protein
MSQNYWEHPSYGNENHDDKFVIVTVDKNPASSTEWESFGDNKPQLESRFKDLDYCDGENTGDGLNDDWEKTDICPRGLVGYIFEENTIKIWASEAITPDYLLEIVRYTLAEAAKDVHFSGARVTNVSTSGVAVRYAGNMLDEVAKTINCASRSPRNKPSAPGF